MSDVPASPSDRDVTSGPTDGAAAPVGLSSGPDSWFDLSGRRCLVTGGTRGIGMAIAEALLRAGASVCITSRKADAVAAAQDALGRLGDVLGVPADVTSAEDRADVLEAVEVRWGELDILVNNAGAVWGAPIEDFPHHGWSKVLETNLVAAFSLVQETLPLLRASGSADRPARVLNIGSIDGLRVPAYENYSYSAAKAGLHHLTRHLAVRLAPDILVNAIAPGLFETKMTAGIFSAYEDELIAAIPLARPGRFIEVAATAVWLLSPAGGYTTGAVVPVDGGVAIPADRQL